MSIYEAEQLSEKISKNTHYQQCFSKSKYYYDFQEQNTKFQRIKNCYENLLNCQNNLIILKYKNEEKKQKFKNECELNNQKLGFLKEEYEYKLKTEKEFENIMNDNKQKLEIIQLENNSLFKKLNQDISNLKKEIAELDIQKQEEIALMKKKILIELNNEYKIKLLKYRNMKELESEKEKKDFEIKKKVFEAEKEIRFNEMKNKAELVQKIIAICKNISLK